MKRKILALFLITLSSQSFAQEALEEALILNDEMQFLENSARNQALSSPTLSETKTTSRSRSVGEQDSLEDTYFEDSTQDKVNTRTAAPVKKRSF